MSCEQIATELAYEFLLSKCEVLEDGENGAWVDVDEAELEALSKTRP